MRTEVGATFECNTASRIGPASGSAAKPLSDGLLRCASEFAEPFCKVQRDAGPR